MIDAFRGRTVAILASGPSMSQAVANQVRAAGVPSMVINNTFRLAPWATALYAADSEWWQHPDNRDALRFAGARITCRVPVQGVHMLQDTGPEGYDPRPGRIRTGGNSGYQAVHLAAQSGARRILLCGFDMRDSGHWHGMHAYGLRDTGPQTYDRWRERFATLSRELPAGVTVVNCTPGSALTCFAPGSLEGELQAANLVPHECVGL